MFSDTQINCRYIGVLAGRSKEPSMGSTNVLPLILVMISFYNFDLGHCYGTKGDNVSFLLNSFQEGYDRRLRPNYGGMS